MATRPDTPDILRRLRNGAPDLYDAMVQHFEADYEHQLGKLLVASTDSVCRQQGVVAAKKSDLLILKSVQ